MLASGGYPQKYETGKQIEGLNEDGALPSVTVYHSGTKHTEHGYVTSGGRVLGITARADTLSDALTQAYSAAEKIHFDGVHYRKDIGQRALNH